MSFCLSIGHTSQTLLQFLIFRPAFFLCFALWQHLLQTFSLLHFSLFLFQIFATSVSHYLSFVLGFASYNLTFCFCFVKYLINFALLSQIWLAFTPLYCISWPVTVLFTYSSQPVFSSGCPTADFLKSKFLTSHSSFLWPFLLVARTLGFHSSLLLVIPSIWFSYSLLLFFIPVFAKTFANIYFCYNVEPFL